MATLINSNKRPLSVSFQIAVNVWLWAKAAFAATGTKRQILTTSNLFPGRTYR